MARARPRSAPTAPAAPPAAPPATTLAPGRRRLFLGVTLALPWVLLALVELGLRLGGYGSDHPLFVPYAQRPGYLMVNEWVGRRWFGNGPFTPSVALDFFRAERAPGTFRIVFQGESSAQGFPYGHGGAPSRMLEQRLQATFPDREIEVVNTALTAVNSHTLLDLADEIVAQRPDAVMIYTGHNEWYGAFGAGSTRTLGGRPALVRAYLALRELRLVQLLGAALARGDATDDAAAGAAPEEAPRTVMQLMAGEQQVPLGSRVYEQGLAQFRGNLDALLGRYQARGIPVYIGTIASNERDQPPFVSVHGAGVDTVAWRRRLDGARSAFPHGGVREAAEALAAAVRLDPGAAEGHWALGRVREALGDTAGARAAYRAAKERDALRFRAPEAINAIIREVAARRGATVVESQQALERASPGGVVGRTLMLEHLHPNLDGYFVIADAFYEALRRRGAVGPWSAPVPAARARQEVPVTAVDSLTGLLRADRLTSGWPFQPRGTSRPAIVDTLQPRDTIEALAVGVIRRTIAWPEAMERLRAHHERAGEPDQAIRVALAMAHEYRYSAQPYMDAARIATEHRRYDEALRHARRAAAREATPQRLQLVGLLLLRQGDQPGAVRWLERAVQLAPGDRGVAIPLTAARQLPLLERARVETPRDTTALYLLAVGYALTQQHEKARDALADLRRLSPAHAGARDLLEKLPP